jgi:glucose-6-phosphate 1-epimerase
MTEANGLKSKTLQELLSQFPEIAIRETEAGLCMLDVNTAQTEATVCMQGAQLLHFQAKGDAPMFWRGVPELYRSGKALRAGVPVCWPWFSTHPQPGFPAHGYARIKVWQLESVAKLPSDDLQLTFLLPRNCNSQAPDLELRYLMTLGVNVGLALCTRNLGTAPTTFSQALHTYFEVGDVRRTMVRGLSPYPYFDYGSYRPAAPSESPLKDFEAIERIYKEPKGFCELIDPVLKRSIVVTSAGCQSTVVWNPGAERAQAMGDLGPEGHLHMLCIESANATIADDAVTLAPGEQHLMSVQYRVIPMPPLPL